jgi:hypothetical protein
MELSEKVIEIIFNIVTEQNKRLLKEIGLREKIPIRELYRSFLFTRKDFKKFIMDQSSSS